MVSMGPSFNSWRDLPFPEIWAVDAEYYPGKGLASGGRNGDPITPHCLVALEMRSGKRGYAQGTPRRVRPVPSVPTR